MEDRVLEAIEQFSLLDGVSSVTVALSGGADSMALLYALYSLKDSLGIKLNAAHFNHMIRGEEADRDQEFVKSECQKLGIELFCGRGNVPEYAEKHKLSTELAARKLRYEFLESVCDGVIATAHTASDSLETALFNLARGTGIKGLCGIPPRRDRMIRPIILCTRQMVEDYCSQKKIPYITDSTNLSDEYTRNRIRHSAVPVLKSINPSAEDAALGTFLSLSEDSSFLEYEAQKEYAARINGEALNIGNFDRIHPAIAKRVLISFFEARCNGECDRFHINSLYGICKSSGKISLPENMAGIAANGMLSIVSNDDIGKSEYRFEVELEEADGEFLKKHEKVNNLLLKSLIDCDKIVGQLVVRTRQVGDTICLKNKNCTKTLKKLYTEYKIPLSEREFNPVISDDLGVVWINGIGVAHRCATDENTERVLKVRVKKIKI